MNTDRDIPDDQFEEIERFLQHRMSAHQEGQFRQKLAQDEKLQGQVEEFRLLILGIEESAMQQKMESLHNDMSPAIVKRFPLRKWLIAASVVLLVSAAMFWMVGSGSTGQKLFSEYFKPDPGLMSAMGSSDNYSFDRAMIDYKTGKYRNAIHQWKKLQGSASANDTLNYFIGAAHLALKEPDSAISYFNRLPPQSEFAGDAKWYLGLALLSKNKVREAIPYIRESSRKEKTALLLKLQQ